MSVSTDEAQGWLREFHAVSATLDTDSWLDKYFSTSAILRYGNMPPIEGRDNIRSFFKAVLSKMDKMEHEIQLFNYVAPRIYQSATITYRIKGDPEESEIQIPGFAVFALQEDEEGRLRAFNLQTWLDPSPLMARIEALFGEQLQHDLKRLQTART